MTGCPLTVRLVDGLHDQHVTRACRSLSFTKTAPGGHDNANFRLLLNRDEWPTLGDNDRVYLYDPRTALPIWEGYATFPGESFTLEGGGGFDLTAKGGADRLLDDRKALVYIDRAQGGWERNKTAAQPQSSRTEWSTRPTDGTPGMLLGFQPGQPINTNDVAEMGYDHLEAVGLEVGGLASTYNSGTSDANYLTRVLWYGPVPGGGFAGLALMTTSDNGITLFAGTGGVPVGITRVALNTIRAGGATTVADDIHWTMHRNISVIGRRMDRFGTLASGSGAFPAGLQTLDYVLAQWVVEDLLGRMMPWADANASTIGATAAQIDQLAYWQPVSAAQVLDDLTLWEPDMLHEVLHTTGSGKHVFNYRPWPTTHRYEISTADGYTKPGSDQGLCNRLIVAWTDLAGNPQTTLVTAVVPELENVGRVRHAEPIALPAGLSSAAAASTIGAEVLADINTRSNSASARITHPLYDIVEGRNVEPWEIQPGYLVRVRENGDILRLMSMTYSWSDSGDSEANLTLGTPVLTLPQRIKRLEQQARA